MLTLLGSLLGFISSLIPDMLKQFQDRRDKSHEIEVMKLQMENARVGHKEKLESINISADIFESLNIYKTYNVGIAWVDALNGTVRPVIAYSFFFLYALVKLMQFNIGLNWQLWMEEDQAIFAGVISFYFGSRAMSKLRK